ncbi:MAG: cation:proton antiporter [Anaerolineae bacterium]|nr:cation:proton antiporter [Anaerolineae bacterium]
MDHGAALDGLSIDILAIIGVTLLVAFAVGRLAHRTGIPQVVGYIVAGVILGSSFLHVIPMSLVENLDFVSELALGLIGFEMGLHLRLNVLRRLGRASLRLFCSRR